MSDSLKSQFLLDPDIVYLNHGSFGACPRPVFDIYRQWQRELERQPVEFLGRRATALLAEARAKLAAYIGCMADEVVFFTNPTTALNMVARSLNLRPGDEILTTDHEYGALDRTWRFICRKTGARYVRQPIPLPVTSHAGFVEQFWAAVTQQTRVVFISHITSPTALTFPVRAVCRRARQAGLPRLINPETGKVHNVSPHRLRDAFAVHAVKMNDSGDGLRMLQEHLGHRSITTTMRYRKVSGEEQQEWYQRLWEGGKQDGQVRES